MDWAYLYYLGRVELRMSEEDFWNCTHKKLLALINIKRREENIRQGNSNEDEYIDNIAL